MDVLLGIALTPRCPPLCDSADRATFPETRSHGDVVDQARLAEPSRHQHPHRTPGAWSGRPQRLGVAHLQVVHLEAGGFQLRLALGDGGLARVAVPGRGAGDRGYSAMEHGRDLALV